MELNERELERKEICLQCKYFKKTLQLCGKCKCFMPMKWKIKAIACPIDKWLPYDVTPISGPYAGRTFK